MAQSPLPWVRELQVYKRPAEDAYLLLHCPNQLAQSPLAFQLSLLPEMLEYMAWNGVTCHIHLNTCHF